MEGVGEFCVQKTLLLGWGGEGTSLLSCNISMSMADKLQVNVSEI
jgi:hypothetical protein